MTDRIRVCTVTFDHDIREDDFEHYKNVLTSIKGVDSVEEGPVVDLVAHDARAAFQLHYGELLFAVCRMIMLPNRRWVKKLEKLVVEFKDG